MDPGLFYRFSYGSRLHFVAVDSTQARELEAPYFVDGSFTYLYTTTPDGQPAPMPIVIPR